VKILIPFTNPVIVGKFVFHCHIVAHEDLGMMQTVEVTDSD
jgi:FtsP/CotA-like multicopper oxidase with cupredoxin domain